MRNILKKYAMDAIWNGTSKQNENNNGGIALWSMPPLFHNAFNPALFTRVKYYHLITGFAPDYDFKPNYITIDSASVSLKFSYAIETGLHIECNTDRGKISVYAYSGAKQWQMSSLCSKILSIDRVGFLANKLTTNVISDNSFAYIRQGQSYEDDTYICKDENNIVYRNNEIDTAQLVIHLATGGKETLTAESLNGKTIFNASEVVKAKFNQNLSEFGNEWLLQDNALFTKYSVREIGGRGTVYQFIAINAVSQIGESYDRTLDGGKILTRFKMLNWYKDYPLDYSVLSTEKPSATANGEAPAGSVTRVLIGEANERLLLDEPDLPVLDKSNVGIVLMNPMDIRVIRRCVPQQPFYVRWINDLGGVDYYMFARQQKHQPQVKSVSSYSPYVGDSSEASANQLSYSLATDNTVTVGCSGLAQVEHDTLVRMPFSPLIEMYDTKLRKWIRLNVSKYDGSYYSRTETKSFEVTFSLPTLNTQF